MSKSERRVAWEKSKGFCQRYARWVRNHPGNGGEREWCRLLRSGDNGGHATDRLAARAVEMGLRSPKVIARLRRLLHEGPMRETWYADRLEWLWVHRRMMVDTPAGVFQELEALDAKGYQDIRVGPRGLGTEPNQWRLGWEDPKPVVLYEIEAAEDVDLGLYRIRVAGTHTDGGAHSAVAWAEPSGGNTEQDGAWHPHSLGTSRGGTCWGDGLEDINEALKEGRLVDASDLMEAMLREYNAAAPYVSLGVWTGANLGRCSDCGGEVSSDEAYTCIACGDQLCSDCAYSCAACSETFCQNHIGRCQGCTEYFCEDHLSSCGICGEPYCEDCLVTCDDCGGTGCASCVRNIGDDSLCYACAESRVARAFR